MLKRPAAKSPWPIRAIFVGASLLLLIGVVMFARAMSTGVDHPIRLSALPSQQVTAFGNDVLYYDGAMLHCVTSGGRQRWVFQIGPSAGFHNNGRRITAWSANQLYILGGDGRPTYNDQMEGEVQFARAGNNYIAAFVGDRDRGTVYVIDIDGKGIDTMPVSNATLLDIGFFSDAPELMWMMGLDTTGTVPSSTMQTYDPGKLATGSTTLGEQLVYHVYYYNNRLRVVDTRRIRTFDYAIKEDASVPTVLIYGWYLRDVRAVNRDMVQLLVPAPQSDGKLNATDLRLITNSGDRVLHLPAACVGATLGSKAVYGFASGAVYMCRYGNNSFTAYSLPIQVTNVLGVTQNDCAIVADNDEVYLVPLPQ